ncbi:hypothetical protein [Kitasatospora sp. A2-31]|uniref:hypothetical protein n=1 Tax=Kitasatospora sp. A2-31 TaxID=2916414 RepID=UPI001EEA08F0|nr:hypothetical protein [Kitasatospora sp. A2-31]MCG6494180.1 hypothetical protein [Kitasatospora sp. A2-31]
MLTDVDHTEFLVAGPPLRNIAGPLDRPPVPAGSEPAPVLQPLAAPPLRTDLGQLLGRALRQVLSSGRTELLAEFAAVGRTADLLALSSENSTLSPDAVAAMWAAAAERRPVEAMMDVAGALCRTGRAAVACRLLESAALTRPADDLLLALAAAELPPETREQLRTAVIRALGGLPAAGLVACVVRLNRAELAAEAAEVLREPRPLEDLPALLASLTAEGLRTEANELVLEASARYGPQGTEDLIELLVRSDQTAMYEEALTALATSPLDRLVPWLASGESRPGFDEQAAIVLRAAVAHRSNRHHLLIALRQAGQVQHLRTAHEECARLDPPQRHEVLEGLVDRGAEVDAVAITVCAVTPFSPATAAELAAALCNRGPAELLPPLFAAVCQASAPQVAEFLGGVAELDGHDGDGTRPVDAAVSALADGYPQQQLASLFEALDHRQLPAVVDSLQESLIRVRPAADLLSMLAETGDTERSVLLKRIIAVPRPPARLGELLELSGRKELRRLIGAPLALAVLATCDDGTLLDVLAELILRHWNCGEELLLQHLAKSPDTDRLAGVVNWLESRGQQQRAALLLRWASRERDTEGLGSVAEALLASSKPNLSRHLLADAHEERPVAELVALATKLVGDGYRTGNQQSAAAGTELLVGLVERSSPARVAELLLALDTRPTNTRVPVSVTTLVGAFLRARPDEEAGSLLKELHAGNPERRPGERLTEAVRAHAPALFRAARTSGVGQSSRYVLSTIQAEPPIRISELRELLTEVHRIGGEQEAAAVLDEAARSRPPEAVAELITEFMAAPALPKLFAAVCEAAAERPVAEVAEVLRTLRAVGPADLRFAECFTRRESLERCLALLAELFTGRQEPLAEVVLKTAPWTGSVEALGRLFIVLDGQGAGVRWAVLGVLASNLSSSRAMELLTYLHRREAAEAAFPVLWALARTADAPATWIRLNDLGWHGYAAVLLDNAPPETEVSDWYRGLHGRLPAAVRAALLRATGADRPIHELASLVGTARAALGAAVLYRSSQDVVDLLVALAGRRPAREAPPPTGRSEDLARRSELPEGSQQAELRRIIAAARPSTELVVILRGLIRRTRVREAQQIVGHIISDEPVTRIVELLKAPAEEDARRAATLIADAALAQGTTADLIGRLLQAGHRRSVELLVDGLVTRDRTGAVMAQLVLSLVEARVTPTIRDRLIESYCWRRRPEEVAFFLHHLGLLGLDGHLGWAVTATTVSRREDLAEIGRVLEGLGRQDLSASLVDATVMSGGPGSGGLRGWRFWRRNHPR